MSLQVCLTVGKAWNLTQKQAIVLEVDVVHYQQPWVGNNQKEHDIALNSSEPPAVKPKW